MRTIELQPRFRWRLYISLTPVWLVAAVALHSWIGRWEVQREVIPIPERDANVQDLRSNTQDSIASYSRIWQRSLREELIVKKKAESPKQKIERRSIDVVLVGTAVEDGKSYALLRKKGGGLSVAKVGGMVDSFRVMFIKPDQVGLDRDGVLVQLLLPKTIRQMLEDPATADDLPKGSMKSSLADRTTEHVIESVSKVNANAVKHSVLRLSLTCSSEEFLRDARVVPHITTSGRQGGFRLDSIASKGRLAASGLVPGDIIVAVDGNQLQQLKDIDHLLDTLDDEKDHTWDVQRSSGSIKLKIIKKKEGSQ